MPPKGAKAPKKSKKTKKRQDPEPEQPESDAEGTAEGTAPQEGDGDGADSASDDSPTRPRREPRGVSPSLAEGDDDRDEKIVEFFADRSYFYDISHEHYKNKPRRNFELDEFAAVLGPGWTRDRVWTRFTSMRTDYGKMKALIAKGKSGQAPIKWTPKQRWKLANLQFLNPYIKRGGSSGPEEEMGQVSTSQNKTEYKCSIMCL